MVMMRSRVRLPLVALFYCLKKLKGICSFILRLTQLPSYPLDCVVYGFFSLRKLLCNLRIGLPIQIQIQNCPFELTQILFVPSDQSSQTLLQKNRCLRIALILGNQGVDQPAVSVIIICIERNIIIQRRILFSIG